MKVNQSNVKALKEVQNFNFASAIAQILNSLQNLLPIVYIQFFKLEKGTVQFDAKFLK